CARIKQIRSYSHTRGIILFFFFLFLPLSDFLLFFPSTFVRWQDIATLFVPTFTQRHTHISTHTHTLSLSLSPPHTHNVSLCLSLSHIHTLPLQVGEVSLRA